MIIKKMDRFSTPFMGLAVRVGAGELMHLKHLFLRVTIWKLQQGKGFVIYCTKNMFSIFGSSYSSIGRTENVRIERRRILIQEVTLPYIKEICQTTYPKFAWRWME